MPYTTLLDSDLYLAATPTSAAYTGVLSTAGSRDRDADVTATTRGLEEIERDYRRMIVAARAIGWNVAADNLEFWLDSKAPTRTIDAQWLRSFSPVREAEAYNLRGTDDPRFEGQLTSRATTLGDGGSETFSDYWDRVINASRLTELFYASGASQLKSTGRFNLTRAGDAVSVTGEVDHYWFDPYDWNPGDLAAIPGFGVISDDDALALQAAGKGHDFLLEGRWLQRLTGRIALTPTGEVPSFTWTGP